MRYTAHLHKYNYIVKNLKHIDGIEFLLNIPSHNNNNNEDQIVYFIKKILKKKQLKIFFFPASSIRIRNKLSMLKLVYSIFHNGDIIDDIYPSPDPTQMTKFGGDITESEYQKKIEDLRNK